MYRLLKQVPSRDIVLITFSSDTLSFSEWWVIPRESFCTVIYFKPANVYITKAQTE